MVLLQASGRDGWNSSSYSALFPRQIWCMKPRHTGKSTFCPQQWLGSNTWARTVQAKPHIALSGVLCSRPLLISKEKVTVSPSTLKFKGGKCTLKTRHTICKRAMNFRDLLLKRTTAIFHSFPHLLFDWNSIPSQLHQPFSCLSWPGSVGNETSVKWATIAQQRDQSKDQILSLISINSPGFCAFGLPLFTFTTSLVPVRWANRQCLEEHRESAGRPCSVLQNQQHGYETKCRKSEDKSVLC